MSRRYRDCVCGPDCYSQILVGQRVLQEMVHPTGLVFSLSGPFSGLGRCPAMSSAMHCIVLMCHANLCLLSCRVVTCHVIS